MSRSLSTTNDILANLIYALHLVLIGAVCVIPFWKRASWFLLLMHVVVTSSIMLHWWIGQDFCMLTLIESKLRGVPFETSFMHRLVSPVYKIPDAQIRNLAYIITPILICVSAYRIYLDRIQISNDIRVLIELWKNRK